LSGLEARIECIPSAKILATLVKEDNAVSMQLVSL